MRWEMPMRRQGYFFRQLVWLIALVAVPLLLLMGYNPKPLDFEHFLGEMKRLLTAPQAPA